VETATIRGSGRIRGVRRNGDGSVTRWGGCGGEKVGWGAAETEKIGLGIVSVAPGVNAR